MQTVAEEKQPRFVEPNGLIPSGAAKKTSQVNERNNLETKIHSRSALTYYLTA
jgi:hypothetical protein